MKEPSVSVRNLTKSFSARRVVDDLSFDVQKGEVFALLGHNGAGKSTTIDLILGLKTPDGGTARILGMDAVRNRKQVFERVGVQLQNTRYQPGITVEEACIEYASLYADPADYPRLLEQFGLDALRKSFVSKLSGGERQKLSVVLALIGDPEIVFLDELTTGLDVVARREVWRTLKRLKEQGLTIFLTTHYTEEAEALCDRVCIIKSGKKITEGTIEEVVAALSTLILTVAAVAVFGYRMQGSVAVYIAVWLLTMLSMFSIGLMVASLCRTTKSMDVATSLLYFPMLLFSGATIPA